MVGQAVSHYRVLRPVGAGGVGEVYEAEDLTLGRHVALKFLSTSRPATAEALQRFEREARTASALNHPHICTIYEFGEHHGQRFIAMELLQGSTLQERLARRELPLDRYVDLAIQIAGALAAAHRAGVVHRDITPSNIFITDEGYAKVMDFGLAKARSAPADSSIAGEAPTHTADPPLTSPGMVIGTVAYMSPEQVRGEPLDSRTDLFSLGSVMYEMATGARAFTGKTTALIFDAILHTTPAPPSSLVAAVPQELDTVIEKCLEKDRDLRYQTAGDIGRDLQRLKRNTSSSVSLRPVGRSAKRARVTALALAVTAMAATPFILRFLQAGRNPFSYAAARQITSSAGLATDPAISPDGSTIAYSARGEDGNEDIWTVDIHGGPPRRMTTDPARDQYPAWFPDGATFAFVSDREGRAAVWRAPRLDGEAATLLVPHAEDPAISPDGSEIAFVRARSGYRRIAIARIEDPSKVRFLTTDDDGKWDHSRPAWSPDGRAICYDAWDGLWVISSHGGPARRLTTADARNHSEPAWSADGRFVYFTSLRETRAALWRVRLDGGEAQPVTVGSGTERTPRISRDGRLLAFSTAVGTRDLVLRNLSTADETVFGSSREELFPAFAPDGRKVFFVSDRWGSLDIWAQDLDGTTPAGSARRIAQADGVESHLACSPDGDWLAYYRILGGRRQVFVVSSAGGSPQRITEDTSESLDPTWSPDGHEIAFVLSRGGSSQIWKQRMSAGRPVGSAVQLTSDAGIHRMPAWSPDGSMVAYLVEAEGTHPAIGIVGAGVRRQIQHPRGVAQYLRWNAATGRLIAAGRWEEPKFELRTIDVATGTVRPLSAGGLLGNDPASLMFDISRNGQLVAFPRGLVEGEIWVLDAASHRF